jgi:hypothetical protein
VTPRSEHTGPTVTTPSSVHHPQGPIARWSSFLGRKGMTSRATQRAVRLVRTSRSWESPGEQSVGPWRWTGDDGLWLAGRRTCRGTRRRWGHLVSAFQADIPDPRPDDLPTLLPTRGVRALPIEILLHIVISEHGVTRTAMQRHVQHIRGGKSRSREGVGHPSITRRADPVCRVCRGMGSHDHPHRGSRRFAQDHVGTRRQRSPHPALCMGAPGNRRLRPHRHHVCAIQTSVIAAASTKAQAGREHLDHHRRMPLVAIQTDEDLRGCEMGRGRRAERTQARRVRSPRSSPVPGPPDVPIYVELTLVVLKNGRGGERQLHIRAETWN